MSYDIIAVSLLGPFEVMIDEELVTQFDVDAARALLAYVSMYPKITHSRLNLATMLWPDQSESVGLRNLRQALNRLRLAIGDRESDRPILNVTRKTLQINPEAIYWLDVEEFTELIGMAEQHRHHHLDTCRPCIQRLQHAVDLYRGDFLEGFIFDSIPFEEWLRTQRERLHRQAMHALYYLARYHERNREYEAMHRYTTRQVEMEQWNEEAHQQHMRALALGGRRSAALAQYETCRSVLDEQLGIEPTQETRLLYERIRSGGDLRRFPSTVHALPTQLVPLVDRQNELGQIAEYLNSADIRLLTLLGPGGIGKTRLAIQAAQEAVSAFQDGVFFIALEAVDSPLYLPLIIATTLNISLHSISNPRIQLYNHLRNKEILLILDNFEQVRDGAQEIAELLKRAPEVKLLVTSRQRLNLEGEWVFQVQGLSFPLRESVAAPERFSAVQLFAQSAKRARRGFSLTPDTLPDVVRICQMVEGVPLAIELAASWTATLTCRQIAQELKEDMEMLATSQPDIPQRHHSLRAVFDHSWQLLTPEEQEGLARLSVFQGSFDDDASSEIANATPATIAALVGKSLLYLDAPEHHRGPMRYKIHSVLRPYATEKLTEFSNLDYQFAIFERYSRYYMDFLRRQLPALQADAQSDALDAITHEIDNVRAAWQWAVAHEHLEGLDEAIDCLALFYEMRSDFREGETLFYEAAAALKPPDRPIAELADKKKAFLGKLLLQQGWFTFLLGQQIDILNVPQAGPMLDSASNALQKAFALIPEENQIDRAALMVRFGTFHESTGSYAEATYHFEEGLALAQAANAARWIVEALNGLSKVALHKCTYDIARTYAEDALQVARAAGDRSGIAATYGRLASTAGESGNLQSARTHAQKSLDVYNELGDRSGIASALAKLGIIAQMEGDLPRAREYYEESLALRREIGDSWGTAASLRNLGSLAYSEGAYQEAREQFGESLEMFGDLGLIHEIASNLTHLGLIHIKLQTPSEAVRYFQRALQMASDINTPTEQAFALIGFAQYYRLTGRPEQSAHLAGLLTHHPTTAQNIDRLDELHTDLKAALPPEALAEHLKHGSTLTLRETIASILEEAPAMR